LLELEPHTGLAVRADADEVGILRSQQRKIGIWKYFSAAQGKIVGIVCLRGSPAGGHAYPYRERCCGLQYSTA
jgi:hypothetical protein